MSRSYKKYPIVRLETEDYRYLNRQLRHDKLADFPKGSSYKKINSSFCWAYRWSKEQAIESYYANDWVQRDFPTLEAWINYWKSCTIRK